MGLGACRRAWALFPDGGESCPGQEGIVRISSERLVSPRPMGEPGFDAALDERDRPLHFGARVMQPMSPPHAS